MEICCNTLLGEKRNYVENDSINLTINVDKSRDESLEDYALKYK